MFIPACMQKHLFYIYVNDIAYMVYYTKYILIWAYILTNIRYLYII
jgi:hypothetical protein